MGKNICSSKEYRLSFTEKAKEIVSSMTLEEKVYLMSGNEDFAQMLEVLNEDVSKHYNYIPYKAGGNERLDIPAMAFCDGPRGVVCGNGQSTCFPVTMCRGASFDSALEEEIGRAMAKETKAFGGNLFAGVCINLPYHPGWGRSQETYGEESFHLGEMGAALVRGVQSENVIACVKHFAFNQMEISRFKVNIECDKLTEQEIFLLHFKKAIDAGAAAVMSSYNLYQGTYCGHSRTLLKKILKKDWDFDGFVLSDFIWGVRDTVEAANGGQDIEMPITQCFGEKLVQAVKDGFVEEKTVDEACIRIVRTLLAFEKARENEEKTGTEVLACKEHRALALKSAQEGITLIKNENNTLPLSKETKKVAVFGKLAECENIGDHGSSQVYPPYVITPLEGLKTVSPETEFVFYDGSDIEKAKELACRAEAVIYVVGYDHDDEGEYVSENENDRYLGSIGGDRKSLRLHEDESRLIKETASCCKKSVVVLIGGNTILIDEWAGLVDSVLMAYYPGMEGGRAIAQIIFGDVNPSGKLPFVIPEKEEDLPSVNWDSESQFYEYYHGYARLEKLGKPAYLPYGYGLSYTSFEISDPELKADDNGITASCAVENTGTLGGCETVQLYIGFENSKVSRPVKLLRGFKRAELLPGEKRNVSIFCPWKELCWYNPVSEKFELEDMTYQVYIGTSSDKKDLLKGEVRR